jgi:putative SOS response-associated peptidase YedK
MIKSSRTPNRDPFGFAGLWEHWTSPEDEEVLT